MKATVWVCFWDNSRTNLYIIDRDFESKKYRYSAENYLEGFNAGVESVYKVLGPGYNFTQDNVPLYTAKQVNPENAASGVIT